MPPDQEWREHLLELIRDLSEKVDRQNAVLVNMMIALEGLKVRSSIWGLAAGSIPSIGVVLMYLLEKK